MSKNSGLFISEESEKGFEALRSDLTRLGTQHRPFRVKALLRVILICAVGAGAIYFTVWSLYRLIGW